LNLGDFGNFSPLNILSAPTFFPLLGQPYFGLQEQMQQEQAAKTSRNNMVFLRFTGY